MHVPVLVMVARSQSGAVLGMGFWFYDGVQGYLRVECDADSPLLYVHIHHIQSNVHLGNVMLYGLILDIANSDLLPGT